MKKAHGEMRYRLFRSTLLFLRFFVEFFFLYWLQRLIGRRNVLARRRALYRSQGRRFKITALELGGLMIKLGQFLSSRVDIMPREYIEELAGLQDQVAHEAYAEIERVVTEELGEPPHRIFSYFSREPEASASLGQVHRAVLPDGTEVAVKIQRPDIDRIVETDFKSIRFLIGLAGRFTKLGATIDLEAVYNEFTVTTRRELDYLLEGHSAATFKENLKDLDYLYLPDIFQEYSTRRVLTMSFVHGTKITDYDGLKRQGLSRRKLATRLINVYLKMVMEDGFFHADPHPGNVFALPDGKVALVDFGMTGQITPLMKKNLRELFIAVARRRAGDITRSFVRLGFIRPCADTKKIQKAVSLILDHFYGNTLEQIYALDLNQLKNELLELVYDHPFQVPASIAFLGRAIGTLVGLTTGLDPGVNLISIFGPYAATLIAGSEEDLLEAAQAKIIRTGTVLAELPELIERVLRQAEQGELKIETSEVTDLTRAVREQSSAIGRLGQMVFASALVVAAAMLFTGHAEFPAEVSLAAALVFFFFARRRR